MYVGNGKSLKGFEKFFQEVVSDLQPPLSYLHQTQIGICEQTYLIGIIYTS